MKANLAPLAATIALLLGAGCVRQQTPTSIAGQVFIVTQSAENVKLGLISVLLIEERQITSHLAQRQIVLTHQILVLQQNLSEAEAHLAAARNDYGRFQSNRMSAFLAEKVERDRLSSELTEYSRTVMQYYDASSALSQKVIAGMDRISNAGGPSEVEVLGRQLRETAARSEAAQARFDEAVADGKKKEIAAKKQRRDELDAKLAILEQSLEAENSTLSAKLDIASQRFAEARDALAEFQSAAFYLSGFDPAPAASAVTDADGKFTLSVPNKGRFAVFAKAQRQVGQKMENYVWLFWLPASLKTPLFLSNRNLVDVDDPNNIFR